MRAPSLHERFGQQGAPAPGERGHKPAPQLPPQALDGHRPGDLAPALLRTAASLWQDPEFVWIWQGEHDVFEWSDLPDMIGLPLHDAQGRSYEPQARQDIAEKVLALAAGTIGQGDPSDEVMQRVYDVTGGDPWTAPAWLAEAVVEDIFAPPGKLRLVNVSKDDAAEFIAQHHSALPYLNPRGLMYAIGVALGDRIVAVATAGSPTGQWSTSRVDPKNVLELTRVASDGTTKGAASKLVARLIDLLDRSKRGDPSKPALFVTYQLASESGTTYRALRDKGLRPVAFIRGRKPSGARSGSTGALSTVDKIRWEAGDAAAPSDWSLLDRADGNSPESADVADSQESPTAPRHPRMSTMTRAQLLAADKTTLSLDDRALRGVYVIADAMAAKGQAAIAMLLEQHAETLAPVVREAVEAKLKREQEEAQGGNEAPDFGDFPTITPITDRDLFAGWAQHHSNRAIDSLHDWRVALAEWRQRAADKIVNYIEALAPNPSAIRGFTSDVRHQVSGGGITNWHQAERGAEELRETAAHLRAGSAQREAAGISRDAELKIADAIGAVAERVAAAEVAFDAEWRKRQAYIESFNVPADELNRPGAYEKHIASHAASPAKPAPDSAPRPNAFVTSLEARKLADEAEEAFAAAQKKRSEASVYDKKQPADPYVTRTYRVPLHEEALLGAAKMLGASIDIDSTLNAKITTHYRIPGMGKYAHDYDTWETFGPGGLEGIEYQWVNKGERAGKHGYKKQTKLKYRGTFTVYNEVGSFDVPVQGEAEFDKPASDLEESEIAEGVEESIQWYLDENPHLYSIDEGDEEAETEEDGAPAPDEPRVGDFLLKKKGNDVAVNRVTTIHSLGMQSREVVRAFIPGKRVGRVLQAMHAEDLIGDMTGMPAVPITDGSDFTLPHILGGKRTEAKGVRFVAERMAQLGILVPDGFYLWHRHHDVSPWKLVGPMPSLAAEAEAGRAAQRAMKSEWKKDAAEAAKPSDPEPTADVSISVPTAPLSKDRPTVEADDASVIADALSRLHATQRPNMTQKDSEGLNNADVGLAEPLMDGLATGDPAALPAAAQLLQKYRNTQLGEAEIEAVDRVLDAHADAPEILTRVRERVKADKERARLGPAVEVRGRGSFAVATKRTDYGQAARDLIKEIFTSRRWDPTTNQYVLSNVTEAQWQRFVEGIAALGYPVNFADDKPIEFVPEAEVERPAVSAKHVDGAVEIRWPQYAPHWGAIKDAVKNIGRGRFNRHPDPHWRVSLGLIGPLYEALAPLGDLDLSDLADLLEASSQVYDEGETVRAELEGREILVGWDIGPLHFALKSLVKDQLGGRWDKARTVWKVSQERAADLLEGVKAINGAEISQVQAVASEVAAHLAEAKDALEAAQQGPIIVPPHVKLLSHQDEGIRFLVARDRALLADDMGLGKTLQTIIAAYNKGGTGVRALVICPAAVQYNWVSEVKKFTPDMTTFVVKNTKQTLEPANFTITNFAKIYRDPLADALTEREWDILIVDEGQNIKNAPRWDGDRQGSKQARAALAIPAKTKWLLTGTPMMNRPKDLFGLLRFLDHELAQDYSYFATRYCDRKQVWTGGGYAYDDTGASHLGELATKLSPIWLRREKQHVTDLPPKTRVVEKPTVDKSLREKIPKFEQVEAFRKDLALAKASATAEKALDIIGDGTTKVIVFSHYPAVLDKVAKAVADAGYRYERIDGSVTDNSARHAAAERFQTDPKVQVFLGQTAAAGVGINLQAATYVVINDLEWRPADLVQAEDRAWRIGQKNAVTVYYMVADAKFDEYLWSVLEQKLRLIQDFESMRKDPEAMAAINVRKLLAQMTGEDVGPVMDAPVAVVGGERTGFGATTAPSPAPSAEPEPPSNVISIDKNDPRAVYRRLYNGLKRIIPDLDTLPEGTHRKQPAGAYMPLSAEIQGLGVAPSPHKTGKILIMEHWYIQNGDLMVDPRMDIWIDQSQQMAEPLTFETASQPVAYVYAKRDGKTLVNTRERKEQADFLRTWLRNLKEQGFNLGPDAPAETEPVAEPQPEVEPMTDADLDRLFDHFKGNEAAIGSGAGEVVGEAKWEHFVMERADAHERLEAARERYRRRQAQDPDKYAIRWTSAPENYDHWSVVELDRVDGEKGKTWRKIGVEKSALAWQTQRNGSGGHPMFDETQWEETKDLLLPKASPATAAIADEPAAAEQPAQAPATSRADGKVPVKEIRFTGAESKRVPENGVAFSTFAAADRMLAQISADVRERDGYSAKVWYEIEWADGHKYTGGRIDVKASVAPSLGQWLHDFQTDVARGTRTYVTREEQHHAREFLAKYALDDGDGSVKAPATATPATPEPEPKNESAYVEAKHDLRQALGYINEGFSGKGKKNAKLNFDRASDILGRIPREALSDDAYLALRKAADLLRRPFLEAARLARQIVLDTLGAMSGDGPVTEDVPTATKAPEAATGPTTTADLQRRLSAALRETQAGGPWEDAAGALEAIARDIRAHGVSDLDQHDTEDFLGTVDHYASEIREIAPSRALSDGSPRLRMWRQAMQSMHDGLGKLSTAKPSAPPAPEKPTQAEPETAPKAEANDTHKAWLREAAAMGTEARRDGLPKVAGKNPKYAAWEKKFPNWEISQPYLEAYVNAWEKEDARLKAEKQAQSKTAPPTVAPVAENSDLMAMMSKLLDNPDLASAMKSLK